jgi:hypothetical protein
VTENQSADKLARGLIPEQRPIWIPFGVLGRQRARKTQKPLIVARQTLVQLRFKRRILSRRQRQLAGLVAMRSISTLASVSAEQSIPAGQIASDPVVVS